MDKIVFHRYVKMLELLGDFVSQPPNRDFALLGPHSGTSEFRSYASTFDPQQKNSNSSLQTAKCSV